jgi:hypothetical protein
MMIPDCAVRLLWAHFKTLLAADAFFLVNPSDIAVLGVNKGCPYWTIDNTGGRYTLPAYSYLYVIRELAEGVLYNLNPG